MDLNATGMDQRLNARARQLREGGSEYAVDALARCSGRRTQAHEAVIRVFHWDLRPSRIRRNSTESQRFRQMASTSSGVPAGSRNCEDWLGPDMARSTEAISGRTAAQPSSQYRPLPPKLEASLRGSRLFPQSHRSRNKMNFAFSSFSSGMVKVNV